MIFYSILIYALFVYPLAKNEYHKDRNMHILAKVVNMMISFFLFHNYIGNTKESFLMILKDQSKFLNENFNHIGILPSSVSIFFWALYLAMSITIVVIALKLPLRKDKSRRMLIRMLPYFWLIESVHDYKYFVIHNSEIKDPNIILIALFVVLVPTILLYVVYTRRFILVFFQYDSNLPPHSSSFERSGNEDANATKDTKKVH